MKLLSKAITLKYFRLFKFATDNGEFTGAIYIDLSKAFDTISLSSLLNTLEIWSDRNLITDYLFNRCQQVSYNGNLSSPRLIHCGVPQGSILGPLLFIIYFNDASKIVS